MALKNLEINIELKDDKEILETISCLVNEYEELCELIPDWNKIEAKEHCDKIGVLLGQLLNIKRKEIPK
jgi:hypothetical protein